MRALRLFSRHSEDFWAVLLMTVSVVRQTECDELENTAGNSDVVLEAKRFHCFCVTFCLNLDAWILRIL